MFSTFCISNLYSDKPTCAKYVFKKNNVNRNKEIILDYKYKIQLYNKLLIIINLQLN
jgi:hypothetical protein